MSESQSPDQPGNLIALFVAPLYLHLLNANFLRRSATGPLLATKTEDEYAAVRAQIAVAARDISDEQIRALLTDRGWRNRLVAGWLVGLSKRAVFVDEIAALLLASEQPYVGQGYCVALGLVGDDQCRRHLRAYLSKYLPLNGRFYDQEWAIGALAHIEHAPPQEYLLPEFWAEGNQHMHPSGAIERFAALVEYLNANQMRTVS